MSGRLEIMVLAVGQGSCNLVKEYDDQDNLIYLALLDCGKEKNDSTMTEDNLTNQMNVIKEAMRERGEFFKQQYGGECTDLYLDHVIISHRDTDHLFFLSEQYLFKDLTPSALAMQKTDVEQHEKIRLRYKEKKEAGTGKREGRFVLEWEDENCPHQFRWVFEDIEDPEDTMTAAEYEYSSVGDLNGSEEMIGYTADYEGAYTFLHHAYFDPAKQGMVFVNSSSIEMEYSGNSQYMEHSGTVNIGLEYTTDGEGEVWVWSVELLDSRWATEEAEHTDIFYEVKVSVAIIDEEYILGVEAMINYNYDGYPGIENGNLWVSYEDSIECAGGVTIQEVLTLVRDDILESLSTTQYCAESLMSDYMVWTQEGFDYLALVIDFLTTQDEGVKQDLLDISTSEQIFASIFTEITAGKDGTDTLLIGNIYVGGNKPAQTHDLAKHAILKTLEYSMHFYDEVCPSTDMEVTAGITNVEEQVLEKWYVSRLFLFRMPSEYYFCESGIPKTKDTYQEYIKRQVKTRKNAIRKANENDGSIISVYHYPAVDGNDAFNYLIPGDATHNTMHHMISVWSQANAELKNCGTLIVAPHHGSFVTCKDLYRGNKTESVLYVFLNMFQPKSIIISAGCPSHYCHPHGSFIKHACRVLTNLAESSDGFYYNGTDKGRGAKSSDYHIGMTRRYLVSTAYYELISEENKKFNYVNHTAVGESNISNIEYVQELSNMPEFPYDMEVLYNI